jgi:hypothetical protein
MATPKILPGVSSTAAHGIPDQWDARWFRSFVQQLSQNGDARNAVGANGITVSGTIGTPATIGFSAPVTLPGPVTITESGNSGSTPTLKVFAPGATISVTDTGRAALFVGTANAYTVQISSDTTTGQAFGLFVAAGSNASDVALQVSNAARTGNMMSISGDGHGYIGAQVGGGGGLFWDVNSAFTFNAPGAGSTITVGHVAAGTPAITYGGTSVSNFWRAPGNVDLGTSGGDYGSVGYNFRTTTTSGSYQSDVTDLASKIRFHLGGFIFETAPSVSAGSAQTYTTRLSITSGGSIAFNGGPGQGQTTGFGSPVGAAVVANYNITDAGGANSNTNKCVAEILLILKNLGFIAA